MLSVKGEVKEHRRFSFTPDALTINSLYDALGLPIVLSYTDSEGDTVSVRTQPDLDEMLRTRSGDVVRMQATVARSLSGSSITQAVKPAVRAVQKMAEPHIQSAKNLAGVAVESAKCAASTADVEVKSAATTTCVAVKKVAEEAIVLGVRGYSLAYDSIYPGVPCEDGESNNKPTIELPSAPTAADVAAAASVHDDQVPPVAPLSADFVKIESSPPATVATKIDEPPVDPKLEALLNELESMGFTKREHNRALLLQNQMDLAATVAMLLDA